MIKSTFNTHFHKTNKRLSACYNNLTELPAHLRFAVMKQRVMRENDPIEMITVELVATASTMTVG